MTMKDADPAKIAAAKDLSKQPVPPADGTAKGKTGGTGQKKEVAGMITQMASTEQKIKETQEKTKEFVLKEQSKQKKYEDELAKIQAEFEGTREKDEGLYNAKIKHEVQFAIVGLAEKKYKAEAELEQMKKEKKESDDKMEEMKKQIEILTKENGALKQRV